MADQILLLSTLSEKTLREILVERLSRQIDRAEAEQEAAAKSLDDVQDYLTALRKRKPQKIAPASPL